MDTTENSDDFYVNQEVGNQDLTENRFFVSMQKYIMHKNIEKLVKIKNDWNFIIFN